GAGRWEGGGRADSMPMEPVARMVPALQGWGGRVSGTVAVGGKPARPELNVQLVARPLVHDPLGLERAELHALYRDEDLEVQQLTLRRGDADSRVTGHMPLILSAGKPLQLPERPMDWKIEVAKGDLGLAPVFVPQLAQARGSFEVHAAVRGTPHHPELQGTAAVHQGVLV